jgi:putative transcriptional regulator
VREPFERVAGEVTMSARPGVTLRKWREELGLGVSELSVAMAVSPSVVSDYESGRRRPGVDFVRRAVESMFRLAARSGSLTARFPPDTSESIPARAEFLRPITAGAFLRRIEGRALTKDGTSRPIRGYTVIDSVKAITGLSGQDYLQVFGASTERALIFTGVQYGRSPMIAVRTHPLKPAMVIYVRPGQVDPLAVKLAELDNVLLATSDLRPPTLLERLEKMG